MKLRLLKLKSIFKATPLEAFCINQAEYELLGFQVYFNDNTNKFYKELKDIPQGNISKINQVGKPRKNKIQSLYEDAKSVFSIDRNFNN